MKKIPIILIWVALVFIVIATAIVNKPYPTEFTSQNTAIPLPQTGLKSVLKEGFEAGKVELLFPYFDEIISICIQEKEDIYLAYHAKAALSSFFESFPPEEFDLKHNGKSRGGQETFLIGDYTSKTGTKFRVYIFLEKDLIQEIEISSEEPIL